MHLLRVASYSGASNDFCTDTLPLMLRRGFEPVALLTYWSLTPDERTSLRQPALPRGRGTNEFPYLFHEAGHSIAVDAAPDAASNMSRVRRQDGV